MNTLEFCRKYRIRNYTINPDNTIDVNGDVYIDNILGDMTKLPVKFGKVSEFFDCSYNNLITLDGCPRYVDGNFDCRYNKLTSLEGRPKYVGGSFYCGYNNNLTTLKGVEKCEIIGNFCCYENPKIPPENYIYIITAKIGGEILTGNKAINKILNTYKNEVKYLHKALSELKKVVL